MAHWQQFANKAGSNPASEGYRQYLLAFSSVAALDNRPKAKVVALFSGQGSQYVNMGRELACNFPECIMQAAARYG